MCFSCLDWGLKIPKFMNYVLVMKIVVFLQRFFPSEFGNDVDRVHAVEPAKSAFATKANIRRAIEAQGIPFTYVSSNFFSVYFLPSLNQPGATAPPRDKVVIVGDGNPKGSVSQILLNFPVIELNS
jgi:hypothetical protein